MEEGNSPLKQIRTFQGDVAEALGKEKPSLVSIQRAEHAKYGAPTPESTAKGRRNQFFSVNSDLELAVATSSRDTLIQEILGKTREIPATELAQITLKTRVGDK